MSPPEEFADGERRPGIAEEDLYRIVRLAVEDAILGVLGVCATGFGLYVDAATLGIVPAARDLLASR